MQFSHVLARSSQKSDNKTSPVILYLNPALIKMVKIFKIVINLYQNVISGILG